jgi:hypothetical protein
MQNKYLFRNKVMSAFSHRPKLSCCDQFNLAECRIVASYVHVDLCSSADGEPRRVFKRNGGS